MTSRTNTMDIKQKSLLVVTIAALGFLGYQIFELVDKDITEVPGDVQTQVAHAASAKNNTVKVETKQGSVKSNSHTVMASAPKNMIGPTSVNLAKHIGETATQKAYVKMLNVYEVEKMHRQLLDEEAAVANARHQIAVLNQKTQKITGQAAPVANDISSTNDSAPLALSYLDEQKGVWSATLHINSDYKPVHVGMILANGYKVMQINNSGVILQKDQLRQLVTFNGVEQLPAIIPHKIMKTLGHVSLADQQALHDTAKAIVKKKNVTMDQAHLIALQMLHQGKEVKAVARYSLKVATNPAPHIVQKDSKIVLEKREAMKPHSMFSSHMHISDHDQYANESEDDMQSNQLSADLHLPSVELHPVLQQPYSVSSYLPQSTAVPKAYHLSIESASSGKDAAYATETVDDPAFAPKPYTKEAKHLLGLNANYYTIQLIGSYDNAVVNQFLVDNEMSHIANTFVVGDSAKPWTIAIYGVYRNFGVAERKLAHLPHHLRVNGAWIRRVGDIQKVLHRYHQV